MKNKSSTGKIVELEGIRGLAALYVFAHHAYLLPNSGLGRLLYFGPEAVIVFFLLSGFVISYATAGRQLSAPTYLSHRIRRIYPVFLIALLLSYVAQAFTAGHLIALDYPNLLGNLVMLQDVSAIKRGVWFDSFGENWPLWSLSYECWFYLLFIPLGLNSTGRDGGSFYKALLVSILGCVCYQYHPNSPGMIAGYYFIWWSGVELAREYMASGRVSFAGQARTLAGLAAMTALWSVPILVNLMQHVPMKVGEDPVLQCRNHLGALIFCTTAIYVARHRINLKWLLQPFATLAPVSYAIYVIHVPILNIARSLTGPATKWQPALLALPVVLLIAWLLEVKLQAWVNTWFLRATRAQPPAAPAHACTLAGTSVFSIEPPLRDYDSRPAAA